MPRTRSVGRGNASARYRRAARLRRAATGVGGSGGHVGAHSAGCDAGPHLARDPVARRDLLQHLLVLRTRRHAQAAPRMEPAARGRIDRTRHVALEQDALALEGRIGNRNRRQERFRIRVLGVGVELLGGRDLHDLAEVHHGDARADVLDDREVVGDEDVREAELRLQILQQVDDLCLDRHVEGRHRLVGDDQLRAHGERAGDADALTLAAGEFVRVPAQVFGRETHGLQQLHHPLLARAPVRSELVDHQRLTDDRSDGHPRIQRRVRILEDDLHLLAQRAQRPLVERGDVLALERDLARGRLDQSQNGATGRGFTATRLAHQPERLAGHHIERHVVHRVHPRHLAREQAATDREVLLEVPDLEERLWHGVASQYRKQATLWPGRTSLSGGVLSKCMGLASAQRGAKRQPGFSGPRRVGTVPGIGSSFFLLVAATSMRGIERSSPCVYGCSGSLNSSPTGASSTTWAPYMTTTRCAVSAMTPMSCVISMMAMPSLAFSSLSNSRICAWMVTSRAVVGSSAMRRFGLHDSAIAIMTRWRIPPESWCGYSFTRRSAFGMCTIFSISTVLSMASRRPSPSCSRIASAICSPTVKTGFNEVIGSWKIIAISLPRILRICEGDRVRRFLPL